MTTDREPLVVFDGIDKTFGVVRALSEVKIRVDPGRVVAIMGHNGAGKSTLMQILTGALKRDRGALTIAGVDVGEDYDVQEAHELGVRCVFQELSLCSNLTAAENTRIYHHDLNGWGWKARSNKLIREKLDEIFPGNAIPTDQKVGDMPIAHRQMIEVARAFTETSSAARIVILDEPTSSLDGRSAEQLMRYAEQCARREMSILFISHRMVEVMNHTDDVVVMRDGKVVGMGLTREMPEETIIEMMGMVEIPLSHRSSAVVDSSQIRVEEGEFKARSGEIVGLAGLAGHGQRDLLQRVFSGGGGETHVNGSIAYVPGDRQTEGIFPLWSIRRNLSIGVSRSVGRMGVIDLSAEGEFAEEWKKRLGIKAPNVDALITSLSGGNQQKVLIARAFAQQANIVLLDDPLRGVDVGTKREVYSRVREAADEGCCFIWYTTEIAELENCDVVYTFNQGSITDCIPRAELTEKRVLESSFKGAEENVI